MSAEQVASVARGQVFNASSKFVDLAANHVPFDQLTARSDFEAAALAAIEGDVSTAILGPVGAGKSSLIAHVCDSLPESRVALRVPVVGVDDPASVSAVAAMTLSTALRAFDFEQYQRDALERERADRIVAGPPAAGFTRGTLGGGPIPASVNLELNTLRAQLETDRLAGERLAGLDRLLDILVFHGVAPVLVLEDTEAAIGSRDDGARIEGFFSGPVRALVREVQAPSLIAVQSPLAESETFRALAPELRIVELQPFEALPARDALRQILERRLRRNGLEFALSEVVGDDALEVLVAFYAETAGSLRHTLAALQTAADHAVNAGSERIRAPHVQAAAQEWRLRLNG
jgi:CDC6/ORC-like protein